MVFSSSHARRRSFSLKIAIVTIVDNATSYAEYVEAMNSVACYARIHSYEYRVIIADSHTSGCVQDEMFFRRHCIVASILHNYDYILFLDADIGVVNPNRTIEDYIEPGIDITFYDRFYTFEVMAGTYLVKNTAWARDFLNGWANYEYRLPSSFHGSDNGALNIYLVELIAPSRDIELDLCRQIWNVSLDWNDVFVFTACVRNVLGDQAYFDNIKILKKGTGWARDSFLTNSKWNPLKDFMLHDMKLAYRRYYRPLTVVLPIRTMEMHTWYNPFVGNFHLELCHSGNSSWNYDKQLIIPVSELEERYRKKYIEVHLQKLRALVRVGKLVEKYVSQASLSYFARYSDV
ncbi:unnamed protein product [Cylicocyclus nassatus]|uniref:Uncharacterized protein n=1 Tax=Cylicocyclus nassatus TaxID=53992 RepID=A0AA36GXU1_CYLNA|nr:unnamed protein product [Cylicocyclus nassatus]